MKSLRSILTFVLCIAPIISNAQNLTLTKGNRTKEIKIGKIISLITSNSEGNYDNNNYYHARGRLVSVDQNSITLTIFDYSDIVSTGKKLKKGEVTNFLGDSGRVDKSFLKSGIKILSVWGKHESSIKDSKQLTGIGRAFIATGVLILVVGTTSDGENAIYYTGGGMILAGIGMIALAIPDKLKTSNDLQKNKNKKYWKIQ